MKFKTVLLVVLILVLIIFIANCSSKTPTESTPNLPICEISSPANGSVFSRGAVVEISVNTADMDDAIEYVQFNIDGDVEYRDTESPFAIQWDTADENFGKHTISVIAEDDNNMTST